MSITLTGQRIIDTYAQLLHLDSGVTTTSTSVRDGDGTESALKLSTTRVGAGSGSLLLQGGSDISASAIELNYLDGSIPGTAVASKAVVLDSSKALDEIGLGTIQWSSTSPGSATAGVLRYDGIDLFLGYTSSVSYTHLTLPTKA